MGAQTKNVALYCSHDQVWNGTLWTMPQWRAKTAAKSFTLTHSTSYTHFKGWNSIGRRAAFVVVWNKDPRKANSNATIVKKLFLWVAVCQRSIHSTCTKTKALRPQKKPTLCSTDEKLPCHPFKDAPGNGCNRKAWRKTRPRGWQLIFCKSVALIRELRMASAECL